MMDLNVMINSYNLAVCYDNSSKSVISGSSCSGTTELWTSDLTTTSGKLTLTGGLSSSIKSGSQRIKLAEGDIDASSGNQAISFQKEGTSTTPTCGNISKGDFFPDPFECKGGVGTDLISMSSVDGKFSLAANVTKVSGDDLTDSAWNMGPKKAQLNYSSGSDNFTFEVRADRWGEQKRAFVSVELQQQSSGSSFGNGEFFEIKVGDQPILALALPLAQF